MSTQSNIAAGGPEIVIGRRHKGGNIPAPSFPDHVMFDAYRLVQEHGASKASRITGIPRTTLISRSKEWLRRIDTQKETPDGYFVKGRSTLYGPDGEVKAEWVKTQIDQDAIKQALQETLKAFFDPLKGVAKPRKSPKTTEKDLMTEYILTDLHLGQYSWEEETGQDYDIDIASRSAMNAIDRLIDAAPNCPVGLLNQMGDFFHADSNTAATPTSSHKLDVDTRHRKVVRHGVLLLKYAVERMLEKHSRVEIRNTPGNHDIHAAMVLDEALSAYFSKEPRVIVHDAPKPFWAYRFGSSLVGIAHGHAPKPNKLPGLLAADYPEWWGQTKHKYCRHGHLHHKRGFTDMGVECEGFPTLAARDAWATGEGFRTGRKMVSIVLHREYGEWERHVRAIEVVQK